MKRFVWILLALSACSSSNEAPPPPDGVEVLQRVSLSNVIANPDVVGVTVDPVSGAVSFIDAWQGIFSLEGSTIADANALMPGWDARPYTDVASLGEGKFALTVENDGLLFDETTGETVVHFCYEPEFLEESSIQLTNSLAYDSENRRFIAQPQTYDEGVVTEAQVAEYTIYGGQPAGWHVLDDAKFSAGGMAVDGVNLLLALEETLYVYTYGKNEIQPLVNLSTLGIERIEGLALAQDGRLFVVDGTDQEIVEISGWR